MLAIIGTAGRQDDAARITGSLYEAMFEETSDVVGRWRVNSAVSGGAAVADHLAVRAFLENVVKDLVLYLPADFRGGKFVPNPSVRFNPGQTCNNYHASFSEKCGIDSLGEIAAAISKGARVEVHPGFHLRNSEVADNATHMLAFTFGSGESSDYEPSDVGFTSTAAAGLKDGGTAHTWGECWKASRKRHVNLFRLAVI